ncbi:Wall-associated protein precursor [Archangium gephyra]|uniref:Wall-associated protein precursor n=1 Tax=Archangium gephyra TaxID=48 RepID=UPI0035D4AD7E
MFASLLVLLLTQLPSPPSEAPECLCEDVLVREALKLAEKATAPTGVVEQAIRKGDDAAQAAAAACSEPTECTGQLHHVISRPIAEALEDHKTLKGQYKPRDERFVTRAVDKKAHCGYQRWHRDLDAEVIQWLKDNREATAKQFEAYLRLIYNRPDMLARFPHGF